MTTCRHSLSRSSSVPEKAAANASGAFFCILRCRLCEVTGASSSERWPTSSSCFLRHGETAVAAERWLAAQV